MPQTLSDIRKAFETHAEALNTTYENIKKLVDNHKDLLQDDYFTEDEDKLTNLLISIPKSRNQIYAILCAKDSEASAKEAFDASKGAFSQYLDSFLTLLLKFEEAEFEPTSNENKIIDKTYKHLIQLGNFTIKNLSDRLDKTSLNFLKQNTADAIACYADFLAETGQIDNALKLLNAHNIDASDDAKAIKKKLLQKAKQTSNAKSASQKEPSKVIPPTDTTTQRLDELIERKKKGIKTKSYLLPKEIGNRSEFTKRKNENELITPKTKKAKCIQDYDNENLKKNNPQKTDVPPSNNDSDDELVITKRKKPKLAISDDDNNIATITTTTTTSTYQEDLSQVELPLPNYDNITNNTHLFDVQELMPPQLALAVSITPYSQEKVEAKPETNSTIITEENFRRLSYDAVYKYTTANFKTLDSEEALQTELDNYLAKNTAETSPIRIKVAEASDVNSLKDYFHINIFPNLDPPIIDKEGAANFNSFIKTVTIKNNFLIYNLIIYFAADIICDYQEKNTKQPIITAANVPAILPITAIAAVPGDVQPSIPAIVETSVASTITPTTEVVPNLFLKNLEDAITISQDEKFDRIFLLKTLIKTLANCSNQAAVQMAMHTYLQILTQGWQFTLSTPTKIFYCFQNSKAKKENISEIVFLQDFQAGIARARGILQGNNLIPEVYSADNYLIDFHSLHTDLKVLIGDNYQEYFSIKTLTSIAKNKKACNFTDIELKIFYLSKLLTKTAGKIVYQEINSKLIANTAIQTDFQTIARKFAGDELAFLGETYKNQDRNNLPVLLQMLITAAEAENKARIFKAKSKKFEVINDLIMEIRHLEHDLHLEIIHCSPVLKTLDILDFIIANTFDKFPINIIAKFFNTSLPKETLRTCPVTHQPSDFLLQMGESQEIISIKGLIRLYTYPDKEANGQYVQMFSDSEKVQATSPLQNTLKISELKAITEIADHSQQDLTNNYLDKIISGYEPKDLFTSCLEFALEIKQFAFEYSKIINIDVHNSINNRLNAVINNIMAEIKRSANQTPNNSQGLPNRQPTPPANTAARAAPTLLANTFRPSGYNPVIVQSLTPQSPITSRPLTFVQHNQPTTHYAQQRPTTPVNASFFSPPPINPAQNRVLQTSSYQQHSVRTPITSTAPTQPAVKNEQRIFKP